MQGDLRDYLEYDFMEKCMNALELKAKINHLMNSGRYDEIRDTLLANRNITKHDSDLAVICYLCNVYEQEKAAGQRTVFEKAADVDAVIERYTILKFYLRRIDFDMMDDDIQVFHNFLMQNEVSSYELLMVIRFSVVNEEKVLNRIKGVSYE